MVIHQWPEAAKPARVVLIGARGFIGARLLRHLSSLGVPVLGLGSAELDLLNPAASDGLAALVRPDDSLVMLAALTPDKGRDIATLMKNLAMAQHVCAALAKSPCAHVVYFSSDAVYPPAASGVDEETPAAPGDLYGVMHLAREIMFRGVANIPTLVLRPSLVFGLEDTHNSYGPNRFRRSAAKDGKITLFGNGEETRDHIHVDDAAGIAALCLAHRSSGTLNVATGQSHSFAEVAQRVARQFGEKIEIAGTPRANPITHRHYDITQLIKAFPGYSFLSLDEGIAQVHRQMMESR
ncbi:MAG: hypothetical protein A3I00_07710 [Betaproteobacteria bacterium RIFCSPLOWO2_02_FULL_64_12]|nr:MAG: hypothetical protein A3I00_07710 [Betaproteobacteria bacterium RIFCSPLOWO2_02_FULL_64_12]